MGVIKEFVRKYFNYNEYNLDIQVVIDRAKEVQQQIRKKLPGHQELDDISQEVLQAAEKSQEMTISSQRFFAFQRIPMYLLFLLVMWGFWWIYKDFFSITKIRLAYPDRDTGNLEKKIQVNLNIETVTSKGSLDGVRLIKENKADMAFVQGGVDFPSHYRKFILPDKELLFFLVRKDIESLNDIKVVCTSIKNMGGSHVLAKKCFKVLGRTDITFVHNWYNVKKDPKYTLPKNVQAVMVAKTVDEKDNLYALHRLIKMGFEMRDLDLRVWGDVQSYLTPTKIRKGYFFRDPSIPSKAINGYWINRFIIARPEVKSEHIVAVAHNFYPENIHLMSKKNSTVNDFLQKADAFTQTFVSIGIILFGLFGVNIFIFRRYFKELNTLISLINLHQSSKDIHSERNTEIRKKHIAYLSLCSDLLGLIDIIVGYYAQINSTLLFNGFCNIIHQRCSNLKINIHLKIQHAILKHTRSMYRKEEIAEDQGEDQ